MLNTSSAAIAGRPACKAVTSAASSTSPAREVFTKIASLRMAANCAAPNKFFVAGPSTRCVVMMCEVATSSSNDTAAAPLAEARSGVIFGDQATTSMPNARATLATRPPISPKPAMPMRCRCSTADSVSCGRHCPFSSALCWLTKRFCAARINAQVISVVASLLGPQPVWSTGMLRAVSALVSNAPLRVPVK